MHYQFLRSIGQTQMQELLYIYDKYMLKTL